MTQAVLTLNAGSSSVKFALFAAQEDGAQVDGALATGIVDRIGPAGTLRLLGADGGTLRAVAGDLSTHAGAIRAAIDSFRSAYPGLAVRAVGHRVVHGGMMYAAPVTVTQAVFDELAALAAFAPLHQPHNLAGISAAAQAFPDVPQVACFDTAFHRNQPWVNETFALPRQLYDEGVRRYGFHGLSYQHIAGAMPPGVAAGRVVVAHLGNGASMCAMVAGRSVASSMGFSTLDGLAMGTRCGQIDPGVLLYLMDRKGMTAGEISDLLYNRSGLLGLSGISNDMRVLEASDAPEAAQAIGYFVARCRREVASLAAAMGGIDALVFTGGIGENSVRVREAVCGGLGWMGLALDLGRNAAGAADISAAGAQGTVLVIPTNEELVIARAARAVVPPGY
jgi:acetate kinase